MNDFMLESLRELQGTLLVLMEQASRASVPELANLEWTLTDVLGAYRDLRSGVITWQQALKAYQIASNVQLDCDLAVLDANEHGNMHWQYAKYLAFGGDK